MHRGLQPGLVQVAAMSVHWGMAAHHLGGLARWRARVHPPGEKARKKSWPPPAQTLQNGLDQLFRKWCRIVVDPAPPACPCANAIRGSAHIADVRLLVRVRSGHGDAHAIARRLRGKVGGGFQETAFTTSSNRVHHVPNIIGPGSPCPPFGAARQTRSRIGLGLFRRGQAHISPALPRPALRTCPQDLRFNEDILRLFAGSPDGRETSGITITTCVSSHSGRLSIARGIDRVDRGREGLSGKGPEQDGTTHHGRRTPKGGG